jgi:hypothetical protein
MATGTALFESVAHAPTLNRPYRPLQASAFKSLECFMAPPTDKPSPAETERYNCADFGPLICLATSLCTWRLISEYAFPALGQGVKVVETLILG